ncbi:class II D-tagatose-bisphosphate aldolase, non-catalytic subunit [Stagnihabitans tardus]|uniref:Tagatose-bisphosphate aldolase n=1 Tax=Stagnihabitans tardus TaxID=2699202 RepID=A0AAE4Y958_9RHOB|nr:class II D-tagatose-bisphosphate aldolase, non-catalytic subunit [Stagnihabitans tardus]NBZ87161.1 tagatose-bisphosphate aldolase [Stagnihabitans tardus]
MTHPALLDLAQGRYRRGIPSICSAHPRVIAAALRLGRGGPVLIEATCNQVNQEGGYTGMTPTDFRRFVEGIAAVEGFDTADLILGGDHLGPNPWKHLSAEAAMARAEAMVAAYAAAGFTKIHLDCSMGCAGEPEALPDEVTATRAARLAKVAEAHGAAAYVIGTEVPIPGGALHHVDTLAVTDPKAAAQTVEDHRAAFAKAGLASAFDRVIGLVVQPGVEFGNSNVIPYAPDKARALSESLKALPGLVFEAHSTDYQSEEALRALVTDGFAILKVGPWLTFALREALYGLDLIAAELDGQPPRVQAAMEALMLSDPKHWAKYYPGSAQEQRLMRHYSYSDRIRYYWTQAPAAQAAEAVLQRLGERIIPETLVSQHLGAVWAEGLCAPTASGLLDAAVGRVVALYNRAAQGAVG